MGTQYSICMFKINMLGKPLIFSFLFSLVFATPLKKFNPNDVSHYLTKEGIERLETQNRYMKDTKISTDLSLVQFYLWTPERDDVWIFNSSVTPEELRAQGFDSRRSTKFIAHGWNSGGDFGNGFRKGYHAHPAMAYNVIAVHWQPLSTWDNYFTAAKNSVKVGQYAGEVLGLDLLINGLGQKPEQIHAIGHSLGAHLVGHFARTIQFKAGSIARVTGLDPAKPWFDLSDESNRISKEDATLVDIIHTNSGFLLDGRLSILEPLGDVDYYPNGGQHQPGCTDACFGIFCLEIDLWDFFNGACSHARAWEYYHESIVVSTEAENFISKGCASWDEYEGQNCIEENLIPMGESLTLDDIGKEKVRYEGFYLETNEEAPFSRSSSM